MKSFFSSLELLVKQEGVHSEMPTAYKDDSDLSSAPLSIYILISALVSFCPHI